MSLYLVPPGQRIKTIRGKRYPNRVYWVRGTIGGRDVEVSAKTANEAAAERFARELERRIAEGRLPAPGEAVTFADAVRLYKAYRDPSKADVARLDKLAAILGPKLLPAVQHAHLVEAANTLLPNRAPGTRNREVMVPAATVMHYAADNGLCKWLRVKRFKEPKPATRAVTIDTAGALLEAAPEGRKRLLLLWLFRQAPRISDSLAVAWAGERCQIDLSRRVVRFRVGKTGEWAEQPIHDEVWDVLANLPEAERTGFLFPWRTRFGVYKWLRPLTRSLGIKFTPHMARHSMGAWLNEQGAGLRTIMDALGHKSVASSIRYQSAGVEMVRAAVAKIGPLVSPAGNTAAKARKA